MAELRQRLERLTPRQREVFQFVIASKMNKNIAAELGTGEQNIKVHRRRVMRKMSVKSLAELVRTAERLGIQPVRQAGIYLLVNGVLVRLALLLPQQT